MPTTTEFAAARAELKRHFLRHFLRHLGIAFRRAVRRLRLAFERMAQAQRHRRELDFLLRSDDRVLRDIGVTRADMLFALGGGNDAVLHDAGQARCEARKVPIEQLPQVASPALAPAMPRTRVQQDFR